MGPGLILNPAPRFKFKPGAPVRPTRYGPGYYPSPSARGVSNRVPAPENPLEEGPESVGEAGSAALPERSGEVAGGFGGVPVRF